MSSNYKMYITYNNENEKLEIPQLPDTYNIRAGSKNESVNISGLGEITIFQDRPALQIDFESYFPAETSTPQDYIDTLIRWKNSKKSVHLIITGTKVNMFCSIENLEYNENGGDVGTIYYKLNLKEYREVKVKGISVIGVKGYTNATNQRVDNRVQPTNYTVRSGDSLYKISKLILGNAERWKEIATLNNIQAPYTIFPSQNIKIPE